jgi:type I restriction enzyme R subunit
MIAKISSNTGKGGQTQYEKDLAIKQLISRAVSGTEIIDIFQTIGINNPDVSILSEEFLADVKKIEHKNLVVELLNKLLHNELKTHFKKNIVEGRKFSEMLKELFNRYQNRLIQTVEIIEELIAMARDIRESEGRADVLGLTEDEIAFYDALGVNDSAVKVLGDENLREIARLLTDKIRKNVTIDWQFKESVRARLRIIVKNVLKQYGYPPDKEAIAIATILEQAEVIAGDVGV